MGAMEHALRGSAASCSYQQPSMERASLRVPTCALFGTGPSNFAKNRCSLAGKAIVFQQRRSRHTKAVIASADGAWNPPTVADTKNKFYTNFPKPLPAVYNTVIQELLVQQHIIRYNVNYKYDEVFALGFVSVFDQVTDGVAESADAVFSAYIDALGEDAAKYRADAEKLASWAKGLSGADAIKPDASGDEVQQLLAGIAERAKESKFLYSKFFAIGLFRLLELTGAKEPQALGNLVKAMNVRQEAVNRDLMTYKGVLSKLSAAKEMMREFIERERKKQAEREAEKKAKQEADSPTPAVAADTGSA